MRVRQREEEFLCYASFYLKKPSLAAVWDSAELFNYGLRGLRYSSTHPCKLKLGNLVVQLREFRKIRSCKSGL